MNTTCTAVCQPLTSSQPPIIIHTMPLHYPIKPIRLADISARTLRHFRRSLDFDGDCVVWTGGVSKQGYGLIYINQRAIFVHRLAWVLAHGDLPDGLMIRHRCPKFNRCCISHLAIGTHSDNVRDAKIDLQLRKLLRPDSPLPSSDPRRKMPKM
jgi:hypothetical protein